jgi:hypothetical protein
MKTKRTTKAAIKKLLKFRRCKFCDGEYNFTPLMLKAHEQLCEHGLAE